MPLIPVLRALFPWYAVLAAGFAVFALTESIGYRALGSAGQSVLGAVSGGIAAPQKRLARSRASAVCWTALFALSIYRTGGCR
jgi:hypothetical protein